MKWHFRGRKKVRNGEELERARRERRISEERFKDTQPVAVSLHTMREENHVKPLIRALMMRQKED
jgi:hypothetical protein